MKHKLCISLLTVILFFTAVVAAQMVGDYLILQDIGAYKLSRPEKLIPGFAPVGGPRTYDSGGVISGAGHFPDHVDKTYEVMYLGGDANASPTVQITQHFGGDSDKWLLHEVEDGYRDEDNLNATADTNVQMRTIDGKNLYFIGIYGAKSYAWLANNNIVVYINCASCPNTKPEPIEVVQAYLTRFPSTITLTDADLKSKAHSETWIKDEMDRRLWLCDKWFEQLQLGKAEQKTVLEEAVKSMSVFLDYREKYYGIKAADEKNALQGYLDAKDETSIRNKLTEYKTWWTANKSGSLIGILSIYIHKTFNYVSNFFKKIFLFLTSLVQRLFSIFG
jgi:hypothetical protein